MVGCHVLLSTSSKYKQLDKKPCWKDLDAWCKYVANMQLEDEPMGRIVGNIEVETAKKNCKTGIVENSSLWFLMEMFSVSLAAQN